MNLCRLFSESAYKLIGAVSKYDSWRRYEKLMESQYHPLERLKEIQWQKLQKLLKHASENVPFYREKWKELKCSPSDIHSLDDVRKLPAVDRGELQAAPSEQRRAENFNVNYLQTIQTSGSTTGTPFRLFIDPEAYLEKYALYLRAKTPSSWRLGDRMISMWHRSYGGYEGDYDGNVGAREPYMSLRGMVNLLFERKIVLPPFKHLGTGVHLDEITGHVEAVRDYNPFVFESFNFLIQIIAQAMVEHSIRPLAVPVIYCLGALPGPHEQRVRDTLGKEIYDRYGPHEMEGIAYECERHSGLHISTEGYIVEFLPIEGRRDLFELAITDLDNYACPLIRYKIGDLGRPIEERCPCGRTLPLMGHLLGRSKDMIVGEGGRKFAPLECEELLYGFDGVSFFSLEQKENSDIIINVVPKKDARGIDADRITGKVREVIGSSIHIEVNRADEIPSEKNGKFRFVKRTQ